jgi:hypothetical protein
MRELRLFVVAVLARWGLVLTGSVVSVAGLLQEQYGSADRIPNWIFWTIAGACLLVACFLAWRDEHRARVKAEAHKPSIDYQAVEKLEAAGHQIKVLEVQLADLISQLTPRSLSKDQIDRLLRFLLKHSIPPSSVTFWHYVSASDGADFARELSEVFERAGWNARAGGTSARAVYGISVSGGTQEDKKTIIDAMSAIGLHVQVDSDRDVQSGPMDVIIGPKPPE